MPKKSFVKKKNYQAEMKRQVMSGKGFTEDGRIVPLSQTPKNAMQDMLANGHGVNRK